MAAVSTSSADAVDLALTSFSSSLPPYLQKATASSASVFADVLSRVQVLWEGLADCEALLAEGGAGAAGLKDGVVGKLKETVLELAVEEGQDVEQDKELYVRIRDVLDLSLALHSLGKLDPRAPYVVLEEAISTLSLDGCKEVFAFLEARSEPLKLPFPVSSENSSGLGLIKACNALLARLSQSEDAALRGRVLAFMASAFSLSARSGVNLRGEFNVGNVTAFEEDKALDEEGMEGIEEEDEKAATQEQTKAEEKEEGETDEEGEEKVKKAFKGETVNLKESFYTTFWSLQSTFSNPSLLSTTSPAVPSGSPNQPSTYRIFLARLNIVLAAFAKRTRREVVLRGAAKDDAVPQKRTAPVEEAGEGSGEGYMPKFLTNPRLLEFELSDVGFRRQVIIQSLILLNFLRSSNASPSNPKPPSKLFKTKLPLFAVDHEIETELADAWRRAFEELDATVPGGSKFSNSLVNVMRREANWATWKDAACPPFDLPPLPEEKLQATAAKRRRLNDQPLVARVPHALGTPALSDLWEEHNVEGLEELENPSQAPGLRNYEMRIKRVQMQLDREKEPSADRTKAAQEQKASLTFRALRQTARTSLDLFAYLKAASPKPDDYVPLLLQAEADAARRAKAAKEAKQNGSATPTPTTLAAGAAVVTSSNPTISVSAPDSTSASGPPLAASTTPSPAPTPEASPAPETAPDGPAPAAAALPAHAPASPTVIAPSSSSSVPGSPSPAPATAPPSPVDSLAAPVAAPEAVPSSPVAPALTSEVEVDAEAAPFPAPVPEVASAPATDLTPAATDAVPDATMEG